MDAIANAFLNCPCPRPQAYSQSFWLPTVCSHRRESRAPVVQQQQLKLATRSERWCLYMWCPPARQLYRNWLSLILELLGRMFVSVIHLTFRWFKNAKSCWIKVIFTTSIEAFEPKMYICETSRYLFAFLAVRFKDIVNIHVSKVFGLMGANTFVKSDSPSQ